MLTNEKPETREDDGYQLERSQGTLNCDRRHALICFEMIDVEGIV